MAIYHIDSIKVLGIEPIYHAIAYPNIIENLKKTDKRVQWTTELQTEPIALVGYGPSLRASWKYLKDYKYIMSMSGAHDFLIDKGIIPTYHIDCDPRQHKAVFTKNARQGIKYLIGSSSHTDTVEQLLPFDIELWNLATTEIFKYPEGEWSCPGRGSVGTSSILLSYVKGFRKFALFGMDSSFAPEGNTHAGDHPHSNDQGKRLRIAVGPYKPGALANDYKVYDTTQLLVAYAKETYRLMTEVFVDCTFEAIGRGLFYEYIVMQEELKKQEEKCHETELLDPAVITRFVGFAASNSKQVI